jgi:outer membrane protein OmpA-like peptidoglycan-associated protein
MALTPFGKRFFTWGAYVLVALIVCFSVRNYAPSFWNDTVGKALGWAFPGVKAKSAVVAQIGTLPGSFTPITAQGKPEKLPFPSATLSSLSGPEIRIMTYFWNGNIAFHYAFGGAPTNMAGVFGTSRGSLMEKYGVKIRYQRQDDTNQMIREAIAFARDYKNNPTNPSAGVHFFTIMGDGAAAAVTGPNKLLAEELGPEYQLEAIDFFGASFGEDALWGPPEWRSNPRAALGSMVAVCSTGDVGDFNILAIWAKMNQLPINVDQTTYFPDAINVLNPKDYIDSGVKYINRWQETRYYTMVGGKREKRTTTKEVTSFSSWTPVDVSAVEGRGGIVKIFSTRDNINQMPTTLIGIRKWNADHRAEVKNLIAAVAEAGRQIKNYDDALMVACDISARIYNERDGAWIRKYYGGYTQRDATGRPILVGGYTVELGGSRAFDLADAMFFMGLSPKDQTPVFKIVYETFGDMYRQFYPELLPNGYTPASEFINPSYVRDVASAFEGQFSGSQLASVTTPTQPGVGGVQADDLVGKQSWTIEFATGSADILPSSESKLRNLLSQLLMGNMNVEIHGHTDSTGTQEGNLVLSDKRAKSVKAWIIRQSPGSFSDKRIITVPHGQDDPVDNADNEYAYAKNRRVEIILRRIVM